MNRLEFFKTARELFGPLAENEVDGINAVIDATEGLPLRHRAYIMATPWLETDGVKSKHMTPVLERGGPKYCAKYEPGTKLGLRLGNIVKGDGYRFRGHGFPQLTGRDNFAKATKHVGAKIGVDFVKTPEAALDMKNSVAILVSGMTLGWFTGASLKDFDSYESMRRTVNGVDRAEDIADYARKFERCFIAGSKIGEPVAPPVIPATQGPDKTRTPTPDEVADSVPAPASPKPSTAAKVLAGIIAAAFAALVAWITKGS